jgi:hypothetical protein
MEKTDKVIKFKSPATETKFVELQSELKELKNKKPTDSVLDKTDVLVSIMTSLKSGFNLQPGKIKKVIKFLKEKTKKNRVRYGTLPLDSKPKNIQFKDITVLYAEKDGQIIFREFEPETIKPLPLEVKIKAFSVE